MCHLLKRKEEKTAQREAKKAETAARHAVKKQESEAKKAAAKAEKVTRIKPPIKATRKFRRKPAAELAVSAAAQQQHGQLGSEGGQEGGTLHAWRFCGSSRGALTSGCAGAAFSSCARKIVYSAAAAYPGTQIRAQGLAWPLELALPGF